MYRSFNKTLLAAALSAFGGGAYAHSILNGYLPGNPGNNSTVNNYDVFHTYCATDDGATGLKDSNGVQWTLPINNGANSTLPPYKFSFAVTKVGSGSDSDAIYATVAYADAVNIYCWTSGNTPVTGQPNLDAYCLYYNNENNILPHLDGTTTVTTIKSTKYSEEWVSGGSASATPAFTTDQEPPISGTKLLNGLGINAGLKGWTWGSLVPNGTGKGVDGADAGGEYIITIGNEGASAHQYDFIAHCTDANGPANPNDNLSNAHHAGQGDIWTVVGGVLQEGSDYTQLIEDGARPH
ncbi:MAG: hypothetical protein ABSB19_13580 [Methylomonas sp.]|jgi:hypothetical protein